MYLTTALRLLCCVFCSCYWSRLFFVRFFFFFQAEDGIRDGRVTEVQTCALPISGAETEVCGQWAPAVAHPPRGGCALRTATTSRGSPPRGRSLQEPAAWPTGGLQIGRASCRERV